MKWFAHDISESIIMVNIIIMWCGQCTSHSVCPFASDCVSHVKWLLACLHKGCLFGWLVGWLVCLDKFQHNMMLKPQARFLSYAAERYQVALSTHTSMLLGCVCKSLLKTRTSHQLKE